MRYLRAWLLICIWPLAGTSAAQLIIVTPPQVVLSTGQTVQMQAYQYLQSGAAKSVTKTAVWTSVEPSIATVSKTGLVTMKGTGSALIIATYKNTVAIDRKSTRLNSSHRCISYAVFC